MTCASLVAMTPTKRTEHIQIRVTPAEKRTIQKAAKAARLDVAAYLRSLALPKQ